MDMDAVLGAAIIARLATLGCEQPLAQVEVECSRMTSKRCSWLCAKPQKCSTVLETSHQEHDSQVGTRQPFSMGEVANGRQSDHCLRTANAIHHAIATNARHSGFVAMWPGLGNLLHPLLLPVLTRDRVGPGL